MKKKLVSIIVNCYNGEKYILQTLKSILSQEYEKFEVIFIDNCSTDLSAKIYKSVKDKRFRYFKTRKNINLYKARNLALKKCKGEFVSFLDADDWWDKNFLIHLKNMVLVIPIVIIIMKKIKNIKYFLKIKFHLVLF